MPDATVTTLTLAPDEVRVGDILLEREWGHLGHKTIRRRVHAVRSDMTRDYVAIGVTSDTDPLGVTVKHYPRNWTLKVERWLSF